MWRHIKPILKVILLATAMLVSFHHSTVSENTTKCPRNFHLVHITKPNYNRVTRIIARTHLVEISNPVMKYILNNLVFCCFFPYRAIQKWNYGARENVRVCTTRYAPILARFCPAAWFPFVWRGIEKNNKKRWNFWFASQNDLKFPPSVCAYILVTLLWFGIVVWIK